MSYPVLVGNGNALEPRSIAIVEDDRSVRLALRRVVRLHDFDVATYSSGEGFLASLQEARPACLLLDWNLPGIGGMEVLRHLQRAGMDIPTIVMTGFDRLGLREQCLAEGAAAFLTKPVGVSDLSAALEVLLDARRTLQ